MGWMSWMKGLGQRRRGLWSSVALALLGAVLMALQDPSPWASPAQGSEQGPRDGVRNDVRKDLGGEVVRLRLGQGTDGDSLVAITERRESLRIRLVGIDAPERAQPHGPEARKALESKLRGEEFEATLLKRDNFGRWLVVVKVDGNDLGEWMLRQGHAWYFRKYARDIPGQLRGTYERAEAEARKAQRGLWALPSAEEPWEFRRRRRDS